MAAATKFTDRDAVDLWDHWFRWRDPEGRLRDRTIDATWWRVAGAIAGKDAEGVNWAPRYVDAFSHWQLLPDERLLRTAGTGVTPGPPAPPSAVLNVAAFVAVPSAPHAGFDDRRFARVAALAVRLLDDAVLATPGLAPAASGLRIGLIGFSDALRVLGIRYDDARAAEQARAVGKALAVGTLCGATELARERGAIAVNLTQVVARGRARGLPPPLIEDMERHGLRHRDLTAIRRQPRLALLANNASDALDPGPERPGPEESAPEDPGTMASAPTTMAARRAIHAAIQPWIDLPVEV